MTRFKGSVEDWRPLVTQLANGKPVDFLLGWMNRESGGNPCDYTYLRESGVFQLEYPDNLTAGGTSEAGQHPSPPCIAWSGPSSCVKGGPCPARTIAYYSSLTPDQAYEQIRGGLQFIDYLVSKTDYELAQNGYTWDTTSSGYWTMVKMHHNWPAAIPNALMYAASKLGYAPPDWDSFRAAIEGTGLLPDSLMDDAESVGIYVGPDAPTIVIDIPFIDTPINMSTTMIVVLGLATAVGGFFTYRYVKPKLKKRFPRLLS